jgi:hypothetical protein
MPELPKPRPRRPPVAPPRERDLVKRLTDLEEIVRKLRRNSTGSTFSFAVTGTLSSGAGESFIQDPWDEWTWWMPLSGWSTQHDLPVHTVGDAREDPGWSVADHIQDNTLNPDQKPTMLVPPTPGGYLVGVSAQIAFTITDAEVALEAGPALIHYDGGVGTPPYFPEWQGFTSLNWLTPDHPTLAINAVIPMPVAHTPREGSSDIDEAGFGFMLRAQEGSSNAAAPYPIGAASRLWGCRVGDAVDVY